MFSYMFSKFSLEEKPVLPLFDTFITLEDIYEGIQFNSAEEEVKE